MATVVKSDSPQAPATGSAADLGGLRILIVHEWLYTWAGAERVLEQLAIMMPHAEVLCGIVSPDMRRVHAIAARACESWVGRLPGARAHHRWFLPLHALAFATHDTSAYDLVISVSHAFEKAVRARGRGAVHLSYCLSPPRYLWDLSEQHRRMGTGLQRLALAAGRVPMRMIDRASANGVNHFVSLSHSVAQRVRRAYGRESAVVYPPVDRKPSARAPNGREGFLLTLGRLVPYKRVDLAIAAAARVGVRLVIAGDGPDRGRLERLAGPGVEFLGAVSEEDAGSLMERCAAFLFCAEEDFGIAPVEANAHGAPVVAYDRGGARETMVAGTTATFFSRQATEDVGDAIRRCLDTAWNEAALRDNAGRFAPAHFRDGMRREIGAARAGARRL